LAPGQNVNRMITDSIHTIFDERTRLMDELQSLLEKQLQLARRGASMNEQFGVLTDKTGTLVARIAQLGAVGSEECQPKFDKLRQLYEALSLVLAAERASVCEDLSRLRKGRKTLSVYRRNTRSIADRAL
jgi:flagellar biosynthesis/type III secretory pathway chaperone